MRIMFFRTLQIIVLLMFIGWLIPAFMDTGVAEDASKGPENTQDKAQEEAKKEDVQPVQKEEASEKEIASAQETAKVETATKSNACLTDQSVIEDLNKRQAIIEEKEKELAKKESEFQARERAITAEIDQLKQVRDEINAVNVAIQKRNEAKLAKLIETVERMSPKAAAKLLSSVDDTLAVETMLKLSTDRLAKIMNIMEPERASQLSEFMTLEKMRKTSKRMPAEANGGEQKNVTAAK